MSDSNKPDVSIALRITHPSSRGEGPLPDQVLDYLDSLERGIDKLKKLKCVTHDISTANDFEYEGRVFWNEDYILILSDESQLETMAERLIALVRRLGIMKGHRFRLQKNVPNARGERDVYYRKVYLSRESRWKPHRPPIVLKPRRKSRTKFPKQFEYLKQMAGRCYGIGGDDIWHLFPGKEELPTFLASLKERDQAELVEIYQAIVRKKHNQWFHRWLEHEKEGERPAWVDELAWLMAFLDRLREGGMLNETRGVARKTVLVYWDDYLCGEPYTVDNF